LAELDAGTPPESVADGIDYDFFIGDRLPKRHHNTVQKIVQEESA